MTSPTGVKVKNAADFVKFIKDNAIIYVDFVFADLRGKQQHTTQHVSTVSGAP